MTLGEWTLLAGMLVNAAVILYSVRLMYNTAKDVKAVHKETNSMRAALEKAEFAKGVLAGKLEANRLNPDDKTTP